MSEIQVASRYAKSLIDLAKEQNVLEPVRQDIELFIRICKENPELRAVLANPIISLDKKTGILSGIFAGKVQPLILNYFKIVVNKGRSEILYATAKEFMNSYNIHKNIVKARVSSAAPLSEKSRKQIEDAVKAVTKGEVILETKVDPDLIGGYILTVGDKQLDASISSSLKKLKKEFSSHTS
ncbi:MAG TPA: ATP synthase F1 subunit delta [Sphingobacteriaceae bacterium]|nr:ATP synthase F1 subunit delta [Sphingobacteriaceae bacterium]